MVKKVKLLKKVSFKTKFGLEISKFYEEDEMNESFQEAFVKNISKVEVGQNNEVIFVFENRRVETYNVAYLYEALKNKPAKTILELIKVSDLIEQEDPLDKTSY